MKLIAAGRTRESGQQQCKLGWCWRSSSAGAHDGGRRSQEPTTEGSAHALRQGSPQPKAMGRPAILEEAERPSRAGTYGARRAALTLWRHEEMQGAPGPQAREDVVQPHEWNGRNEGVLPRRKIYPSIARSSVQLCASKTDKQDDYRYRLALIAGPALTCCF
ncbi:hypothetical protein SEVIR_2G016100v4 [Setaria viridis]|uniref:Uncharacterized protein n=1 Tax=Setaria viridis TaxID=4556 RepID=A0A4U6VQR8_SETVI|nr:hypothetical protein SEVIR_2G016100v2 [Setaria viridis]